MIIKDLDKLGIQEIANILTLRSLITHMKILDLQ